MCGVVIRAIDEEKLEIQLITTSDFIHPLRFSGETKIVNVHQCSLATRNLLTQHQRQSAFGIPGIMYNGRPWYSRVVHSEFYIDASVGSCVASATGSGWRCLGFVETGQKRYPTAILLFDPVEKDQVIEMKLMNGTGLTVIPPTPSMDATSLRSAYAALQSTATAIKPQQLRSQDPLPGPARSRKSRERSRLGVSLPMVGRGQVPNRRGRGATRSRTSPRPAPPPQQPLPSHLPLVRSQIVVVSDHEETPTPLPKKRARSPSTRPIPKQAEIIVPETTTLCRPRYLQEQPVSPPISYNPIDLRTFGALAGAETVPSVSAPLRSHWEHGPRPQESLRSYLYEDLVDAEELATRQNMEMRHAYDRQVRRAEAMSRFDRFFRP